MVQIVAKKRAEAMEKMEKLKSEAKPLIDVLENAEALRQLKELSGAGATTGSSSSASVAASKLAYLSENFGVTESTVKALFALSKHMYECGNYEASIPYLSLCREVCTDGEMLSNLLWGKLATSILMERWSDALSDFQALESRVYGIASGQISTGSASASSVSGQTNATLASNNSQTQAMQQRAWLLHWSLPIFFNMPESRQTLLEFYQHEKTWQVLQMSCPHLLRYMIVAPIVVKRRFPKDIMKLVDQEAYQYSDPVTKFIETLYAQTDFEMAEAQLAKCAQLFDCDPLLHLVKDDFLNNCRQLIFELYCKLHSCIDTRLLASKKPEKFDDAEKWIGELIRGAKLDAKIDTQANQVLIGAQSLPLYQQLIDRTKLLTRPLGPVSGSGSGPNKGKHYRDGGNNRDGGRHHNNQHGGHSSNTNNNNNNNQPQAAPATVSAE